MTKLNTERLAILETEVKGVSDKLDEHMIDSRANHEALIKRLDGLGDTFVTKDRFTPIEKVVYGLVGAVLIGVATAILALVIKN